VVDLYGSGVVGFLGTCIQSRNVGFSDVYVGKSKIARKSWETRAYRDVLKSVAAENRHITILPKLSTPRRCLKTKQIKSGKTPRFGTIRAFINVERMTTL
jgi:hypothetical protein